MDLDLKRYLTERANKDATIKKSDDLILKLQDRIKHGLESARNAAGAAAEQFASKNAAIDYKDEQIAALTTKLAQFDHDAPFIAAPVYGDLHAAGPSGKKRSRQGILNNSFQCSHSNVVSAPQKFVQLACVCLLALQPLTPRPLRLVAILLLLCNDRC
jgi:hypothetical protein